jgi:hypothetical protein
MYIKRKTCDIRTWEKIYLLAYPPPTLIHLSHRFTSASKPAAQKSLDISATSAPPFQPLPQQRNVCHPVVNRFTREKLPTVNRKHFFMNILCTESFCSQKTHNKTLLFSSTFSNSAAILTTETSL